VGDRVIVEVRDGLKPGVVRGEAEGEAFVYLVMPVRLPAPVG
jgi:DNA polymerase III sliding clamp (beta) subunit (PCNA family)